MTSRAASTPASESRKAAVRAPTRAGVRRLRQVVAREDQRGRGREGEERQEEARQRVEAQRRRDVAAKRGAQRLVADEHARCRRRRAAPSRPPGRSGRRAAGRAAHAGRRRGRARARPRGRSRREHPRSATTLAARAAGGAKSSPARSSSSSRFSSRPAVRICLRELEQVERPRVLHAVVDVGALAPAGDEALLAQRREVLRGAAGVELERLLEASRPCARRRAGAGAAGSAPDGRGPGRSRPSGRRWELAASGPALR